MNNVSGQFYTTWAWQQYALYPITYALSFVIVIVFVIEHRKNDYDHDYELRNVPIHFRAKPRWLTTCFCTHLLQQC